MCELMPAVERHTTAVIDTDEQGKYKVVLGD